MYIFWQTFGLMGAASCAAWAAAAAFVVAGVFSTNRMQAWLRAAAIAIGAVLLAIATSESIRSIEVDRSAEVLAAEAAGAKAAQAKLRGRAAGIRFAEDTAADQADIAGVSVAEEQGAYERAVEEELVKTPAYRSRGRQTRVESRKSVPKTRAGEASQDAQDNALDTKPSPDAAVDSDNNRKPDSASDAPDASGAVRMLPESQLVVADQLDRINRAVAQVVLALALGLVGFEYIQRWNSTFDSFWPVPLAGTLIDGLSTKSHMATIAVTDTDRPLLLARFLSDAVRKGESFILFAQADPLPQHHAINRFAVGPLGWNIPKRTFAGAELAHDPSLTEIVFETAWFGRGAFVVTADAAAPAILSGLLSGIVAALNRRHCCRATARRTLNIVWALPEPPPADITEELAYLCPAMNLRFVVVSQA